MSMFNPLRIEIEMATSVIQVSGYPLHLDGLIYWAIFNFLNNHDLTIHALDETLSKSKGVYHASQAIYEKNSNKSIMPSEITRLTVTDWKNYNEGFSHTKKSIKENEGPFCKKFNQFNAVQVQKIIFFAHGDLKQLEFYLNSLTGIGKGANAGFGEIRKITLEKIIEDKSWFIDDKLNRILPTKLFSLPRNEPVRNCRFSPNYVGSEIEECYVPINNVMIV
jgi:CRISPR type IV-associated protein Csf3